MFIELIRNQKYFFYSEKTGIKKNYLCFARSSHMLYEIIPTEYFWSLPSTLSQDVLKRMEEFLQINAEDGLSIYRILNTSNNKSLQEVFQKFKSNESEALLLLADVKQIPIDVINHVRLLMEDFLTGLNSGDTKIIILVLHFPSSNFFKHCYPSLFMNGWSHHYLDSFGHGDVGCLNITKWLMQSCGISCESDINILKDDDMRKWLIDMLPIICAYIEIDKTGSWPHPTDNIHNIWTSLVLSDQMSSVFFDCFRNFWDSDSMTDISNKTVSHSARFRSTMGISDLINFTVRTVFTDFSLYLCCLLNKFNVLHTLYTCQHTIPYKDALKIAAHILKSMPLPSVSHLKEKIMIMLKRSVKVKPAAPQFPFFHLVYKEIEKELDQCIMQISALDQRVVSIDESVVYLQGRSKEPVCNLRIELLKTLQIALLEKVYLAHIIL